MNNITPSTGQGGDNKGGRPWWQPGMILFSRLSAWIVGPVVLAVILGKWLDGKFGTKPWLFLFTVGIAFIFSMIGLVKEGTAAMKKAENDNNDKKDQ